MCGVIYLARAIRFCNDFVAWRLKLKERSDAEGTGQLVLKLKEPVLNLLERTETAGTGSESAGTA